MVVDELCADMGAGDVSSGHVEGRGTGRPTGATGLPESRRDRRPCLAARCRRGGEIRPMFRASVGTDRVDFRYGWGTRIRTWTNGVRVRSSTVKLSPTRHLGNASACGSVRQGRRPGSRHGGERGGYSVSFGRGLPPGPAHVDIPPPGPFPPPRALGNSACHHYLTIRRLSRRAASMTGPCALLTVE